MEENHKIKNFILFTYMGEGLSIAYDMQRSGVDTLVAMVDDAQSIGKKEDPETHRRRWEPYTGMLKKEKAEKVIKALAKVKNKDDYFLFFDFNCLWPMAEEALKMGFTNGLFPTKKDFELEEDRKLAKDMVEKYYPDVKVKECMEFKTVEEGLEYMEENPDHYALKSNDSAGDTVVPKFSRPEWTMKAIKDHLVPHRKDYESKGYILEKQIRDGIEINPQIVCYNGEPIHYLVTIEAKPKADGDYGPNLGCASDYNIATEAESKINQIAFPPIVYEMAKKHTGLFYWDCNVIMKDDEFYFIEFCGNRPGYDALVTELDMAGGARNYFESIVAGENPLKKKYGVAVRGLNINKDEDGKVLEGNEIFIDKDYEEHIWMFEVKKDEDGGLENTGFGWDLVVFTESSDDLDYAIIKTYEVADNFGFPNMEMRTEFDTKGKFYPSCLRCRLEAVEPYMEVEND